MTRCHRLRTLDSASRDSARRAGVAECSAMMTSDLDQARGHQAQLRLIVERHSGAAADYRALRRVLDLCRRAAEAVDDRYCREKLRQVEDFGAELFSHSEHGRWERETMPGGEFLKQQILGALELFHSRLYSIEVLRRSTARLNLAGIAPLRT
jgi:signal transduction protein with GAF and PtsI domain